MQNKRTNEHRTFRIRTIKDGILQGKRIVSLLSGHDNTDHYQNFGFLDDKGIHVWKKRRGIQERSAWDWYAIMLWAAMNNDLYWTEKYSLLIEKHCIRCNRLLTHPESIRSGIGPECALMLANIC